MIISIVRFWAVGDLGPACTYGQNDEAKCIARERILKAVEPRASQRATPFLELF